MKYLLFFLEFHKENQPLSSEDEINSKTYTLEYVLSKCGAFNRYQFVHFFFILLLPTASGIFNFYYVFGAAYVPHRCDIDDKYQSNFSIEISSTQCSYALKNASNQTIETYTCQKWTYDRTRFGKTFTEEINLVCHYDIQRSYLATILQIGAMMIFFSGKLTDMIGRRRSTHILVSLLILTSLITQGLLQYVSLTDNQKYGLLFVNQFVSGIDTFMISLILLLELTTSKHAAFIGNLALVAFTFGEIVVAGMAYFARDWLLLKWMMTLYMIVIVPYLFFLPESPHWYLMKRRYDDLEKLLRQIARFNRRKECKWLPFYKYMIEHHRKQKEINQKNTIRLSSADKICRFLTHIPIMSRLFIAAFLGFVTLLLYFQIAYDLGAMDHIDPYLNIIIGALVEAISYIAASLFMISYGRKTVFIGFLLLTMVCVLFKPMTSSFDGFVLVLFAQLGKFAISGAVCVTYIFVPELFPTSIRATGMGFFVLFSRLGSTIAPIIDALISHDQILMRYISFIFSFLTIICIVLTLFLPETRNVPLADKIEYHSKKNPKIQTINN